MSGGVFICYRREETAFAARAIHDRVVQRLERENLFLDFDNIALGVDWFNVLTERVSACDALVAVIGRNWISVTDKDGLRRIDDPDDFVRIEIETALKRDVRVIPVLVDGAAMPKASELPESLKGLARRQGTEVSPARFEADVEKLTAALVSILDERRRRDAAEAEAARQAEEERRAKEAAEAQRIAREEQKQRETAEAARSQEARRPAEEEAARRTERERVRAKEEERAETRGATALRESLSPAQPKAATPPRLWDPHGKPPSFVALEGHQGALVSAAFSPDGTHVVTASWDKTARVWDLREKQPSFVALEGHQDTVNSAAFSPDGTHVVTASEDMTARVWDLRQPPPRWNLWGPKHSFVALEGHQNVVYSAAFSPDGTHVVTASRDKTARVWDLRAKQPSFVALEVEGIQGPVNSAAFSPHGTHVVTASGDHTARVWDLREKQPSFVALEGHQRAVVLAVFSPDGTHVLTAFEDKTARVWDLRVDKPTFVALEGHQDAVKSAAFSPDGTRVVTASYDRTARVWDGRASAA